jgi:Zn-dependent protease
MKWSWKIARIADIDIYIHATFLLLIYLVGINYWTEQGTLAAVASGLAFILSVFGCVVLHELGHSLTARRYGIRTRKITLLPIGGIAQLEKMPEDPRQEINVAIAGPAVNFTIALFIYFYLYFGGAPIATEETGLAEVGFPHRLMIVNILLGGFNLLPAFPLDGGRVLRAALALRMDRTTATQKAARFGQLIALGIGLLGMMYNPFLVFIAIFIWFGASMESSAEQLKSVLAHASLRHALLREFHTLSPQDNLAKAAELTLAGSQKDFPVRYPDKPDKVLHHSDLIKGLREKGEYALIADLPLQDMHSVDINEPLGKLLEGMQGNPAQMVYVTEAGNVVGLLNLENILELIKIQEAVQRHHTSPD